MLYPHLTPFVLICIYLHPSCTIELNNDIEGQSYVWKVANDLNDDQFKFRSWVVHYDGDTSKTLLKKIYGHKNESSFVTFNNVNSLQIETWGAERIAHLYIAGDLEKLSTVLSKEKSNISISSYSEIASSAWLIYVPKSILESDDAVSQVFGNASFRLDSFTFLLFQEDKSYGNFEIRDIYKIDQFSNIIETVSYGSWNRSHGISISEENIWIRRSNMKGHELSVTSFKWGTVTTNIEDGCQSFTCFNGYYPDMFIALQSVLNFTFTIEVNAPQNILGIVKDNEIDVAVVPFGYTEERNKIVDFLMLASQEHGYIYVRNPRETFDWEVYTKPLRIETWIGLLLFGSLIPMLMLIPMYKSKCEDPKYWSLTDCYSVTYRSFLMLGSSMSVDSSQRRIAYLSIMIMGMICYWLWEAQLISYFSFPSKSLPFNNLEEFLEKSDNKLIVRKGSLHENHFRFSKDPVRQRIYNERILPYIDDPVYEGQYCDFFEKVVEDPSYAAYVMALTGELDNCLRYETCEVVKVPYVVDTVLGGGWLFPKGSPFLPIMQYYVSILLEAGIYERIKSSYLDTDGKGQTCPDFDGSPIGPHKVFSLFGIIVLGIVLSLLLLICETMISPNKLQKNKA